MRLKNIKIVADLAAALSFVLAFIAVTVAARRGKAKGVSSWLTATGLG